MNGRTLTAEEAFLFSPLILLNDQRGPRRCESPPLKVEIHGIALPVTDVARFHGAPRTAHLIDVTWALTS